MSHWADIGVQTALFSGVLKLVSRLQAAMVLLKTQPRGIHSGYTIKRYGGKHAIFHLQRGGGCLFKIELISEIKECGQATVREL